MRPYWRISIVALALGLHLPAYAAGIPARIYYNPNCGCCESYAQYLTSKGFAVERIPTTDAESIKKKYAVAQALEGCHTAVIGDYVFEGLVPAEYVKRVLDEHRPMRGLSVPGMPMGGPGMAGPKDGPINVYYLSDVSPPSLYATF